MTSKVTEEVLFSFISQRLKQIRMQKGFSNYEHLAYELGISRSQYGRYENGGNMKITTLIKILNFLDITIEEFFNGLNDYKI